MKDEVTYEIECEVCNSYCEIIVEEDQENPSYCPMCGSPVEVEDV